MKKTYMLFLMLIVLCLSAASAPAQIEEDFSYRIDHGEARITRYSGNASSLILPDTLGGCPVTSIGGAAFRDCTSLTEIVIPQSVTSLGMYAFQNCTSLSGFVIPDSVTRIDHFAFSGCSALTEIALHDQIDRIAIYAFYGCSAARTCSIDSRAALILSRAGYAFNSPEYPMLALTAHEDGTGARTFTVSGCDKSAVSVSFPDGVTAIGRSAFYNCASLAEITLPEGVTDIGHAAFARCPSLRQITLPGSVVNLDSTAFSECTDLTIIAPAGSTAQAIAQENAANGFTWQPL